MSGKTPSDTPPAQTLPVPAGPRMEHDQLGSLRARKRAASAEARSPEFTTQVLGGGEKRGLKGGPDTLDQAKSTYLQSEYSGPYDRRPRPGLITKTKI